MEPTTYAVGLISQTRGLARCAAHCSDDNEELNQRLGRTAGALIHAYATDDTFQEAVDDAILGWIDENPEKAAEALSKMAGRQTAKAATAGLLGFLCNIPGALVGLGINNVSTIGDLSYHISDLEKTEVPGMTVDEATNFLAVFWQPEILSNELR